MKNYIKDCFIIGRDGEDNTLFKPDGGEFCVHLERYAIIPIERYEELLRDFKETI